MGKAATAVRCPVQEQHHRMIGYNMRAETDIVDSSSDFSMMGDQLCATVLNTQWKGEVDLVMTTFHSLS